MVVKKNRYVSQQPKKAMIGKQYKEVNLISIFIENINN